MSLAIRIENLGKKYRVNHAEERLEYQTLRETLGRMASAPWRRLRHGPAGQREDFWALRDISFDVHHGDAVGIIGRNGAGKSTLLKILSQITRPTTGCVKLYGRVASLLEVGTGFHSELTGRENIFLNGSILGMSRAEIQRKFDEIVDFSGVERFLDTPIKRYSSGMKVRLAFSVAAHLEPEILIIDEVLAVGDADFQKKCLGKMNDVAHSGRTVLFVSHNLAATRSLCTRGLLLSKGRSDTIGTMDEVVSAYRDSIEQLVDAEWREEQHGDPGRGEEYRLKWHGTRGFVAIRCGERVQMSFTITCPSDIANPSVGMTLRDRDGIPVVGMSSKVQCISTGATARTWRVAVDMREIPLNAGRYTGNIYFGNTSRDFARFSDAFVLEVEAFDVFGWGKALPASAVWGPIYWRPNWSFEPGLSE